jgi:hypothetical protein
MGLPLCREDGSVVRITVDPRQRSHSQVRVPRDSRPHFSVSDSGLPKLEDQIPVFISLSNRTAQLHPQTQGSLFFARMNSSDTVEVFKTDSSREISCNAPIQELIVYFPESESESYVTTDGQPASLSWNKAPIWSLRPDLYYCLIVAGLLIWGALSDERTGLSFALATGPR